MRRERSGFWIGLCAVVLYPLVWVLGRPRFAGRHYLPPTGGALVVANHVSHLDPVYTSVLVHSGGRVPRFLAKESLWRKPVLRWVMPGAGQIPVHRDSADAQQSLRDAVAAMAAGKVVIIYPEGTITRDPDGWPMLGRTGVARLALSSDVPVLPCVHWGTREIYDGYRGRFRPWPRKPVVARLGPPVDLSGYRGRPIDAALLREVTDLIMTRVRDLLAQERVEVPPAEFFRRASVEGGAA